MGFYRHKASSLGLVLAGLMILGAVGAPAAPRGEPLNTPALLVELARDHGLNRRGEQTPADVLHIKTLLQAASRLNPRLSEPYVWLYELAVLGGDQDEAADVLEELVTTERAHEGAFALWVETGPRRIQTAEQRADWLRGILAEQRAPALQSIVHAQLARLALQRLDRDQAVQELERAQQRHPLNPDVTLLALELLTPDASLPDRLQAALRALRFNPVRVELAWQVGSLLEEGGFSQEARTFFEYALAVHGAANPDTPAPPAHVLQLAWNAAALGQLERAVDLARNALATDPRFFEAAMFLHWALKRAGRQLESQMVRTRLAQHFAEIKSPDEWDVNEVAQASWFHCTIDPQPQRALVLAESAARRVPSDAFAARVLGWARALNLKNEEAQRTLAPIASKDAYATYQLAKLLKAAGDDAAPARLLEQLEVLPRVGPAQELLGEFGLPAISTQPAAQRHPQVLRLLGEFDRGVLDLYKDPARFVQAELTFEDLSPLPGEPWYAIFTITNRSRGPLTLGAGWTVNPVFLLSFRTEGDRQREFPNLLTVSLDRARVLAPGESVRMRQSIQLGPLRRLSRQTPQQLQRVVVSTLLDPRMTAAGVWQPGVTGQRLQTLSFNRLPARTSAEGYHALFRALTGESDSARFRAIEVMAELLGEHQRAAARQLSYKPAPIPADRIYPALLAAVTSDSWETRVRALDALQVSGLDATMVGAVEACLHHEHWLVRLMAVRLLARQGRSFAETAKLVAAEDTDELVKDLARSYLERWTTTQPGPSEAAANQTPDAAGATER